MRQDDDDDAPPEPTPATIGATLGATAAPPGTALPRPARDTLGLPARYALKGLIGAGGMGVVHRAFDAQLRRPVAIKIFEAGADADPLREARLTAALAHPNIMPIYDAGETPGGQIWQSMQLIEGRDLSAVLADPRLTLRPMVELLMRVAQAMAYAHAAGVVHRDLKPANIRVDTYDRVFVLDWGIAARAGARAPGHATPAYAAPEQLAGEVVTPAFDVFALGRLLAGVLTAADADDDAQALFALRDRCAQAAGARPRDGAAFAATLRAWLDGAQRRTEAEALVVQADAHLEAAEIHRVDADTAQREADAILAPLAASADWTARRPAWRLEDQAAADRVEAERLAVQGEQLLQAALRRFDRLPSAMARLESMHAARLIRAEALGDAVAIAQSTAHLRALDTPTADALLNGMGRFSLATAPAGARVRVAPFELHDRRWVAGAEAEIGTTPLVLERPPGRYQVRLLAEGRAPVVLPVLLSRGGPDRGVAPGELAPHPVALPTALTEGECYVPAGWFHSGGDPLAADSLPPRQIWVGGFVIERHPLTFRRFIDGLNTLCAAGQADRAAAMAHLPTTHDEHACLRRDAQGRYTVESFHGVDVLDWPVTQISWTAANAWAAWRAEQTGLPWRLPDELEREKAARGTDGRPLPWGAHFEPTWACVSVGRVGSPSRASVFESTLDVSVYGVRGLAGNVRDWCRNEYTKLGTCDGDRLRLNDATDEPAPLRILRGGYFSGPPEGARAACRYAGDPHRAQGYMSAGVRLARSI